MIAGRGELQTTLKTSTIKLFSSRKDRFLNNTNHRLNLFNSRKKKALHHQSRSSLMIHQDGLSLPLLSQLLSLLLTLNLSNSHNLSQSSRKSLHQRCSIRVIRSRAKLHNSPCPHKANKCIRQRQPSSLPSSSNLSNRDLPSNLRNSHRDLHSNSSSNLKDRAPKSNSQHLSNSASSNNNHYSSSSSSPRGSRRSSHRSSNNTRFNNSQCSNLHSSSSSRSSLSRSLNNSRRRLSSKLRRQQPLALQCQPLPSQLQHAQHTALNTDATSPMVKSLALDSPHRMRAKSRATMSSEGRYSSRFPHTTRNKS